MREQFTGIETVDQAQLTLKRMVSNLCCKESQKLCDVAFGLPDYWTCIGSRDKHHDYPGGNSIHTAQVAVIAMDSLRVFKQVDHDSLVVAVVWHDAMKGLDYRQVGGVTGNFPEPKYERTEHCSLIGHLCESAFRFYEAYFEVLTKEEREKVNAKHIKHIMLSHHGRQEWGSPVLPQTLEAMAVHNADMLSSRFAEFRGIDGLYS